MNVLLLQLDGKIPNLALMRIAGHHRAKGDMVTLAQARTPAAVERGLWDQWDLIYASLIFEKSRPIARRLLEVFPGAAVGGPGWDENSNLEKLGITAPPDYSDYPAWPHSLGYTQRGCRLACSFCKVPVMEGKARPVAATREIWRGEPWPRHLLLLDNDFFGQAAWPDRIAEMRAGNFKVCFNQGINLRLLSDPQAAALASVDYRDDSFRDRRLYTAWDNRADERALFRGLQRLTGHGIRPDDVVVYMLVGYWHGPRLHGDDLYRAERLREFGCRPYPMPYMRTRELVGFQRWIVGAYDKRFCWSEWERADYRPEKLGAIPATESGSPLFR